MCSINHDLKTVFIHIHKTGGTYISYMLQKYYGFKNYYLRRPDHDIFCMNKKKTTKYLNYENRIHGVLNYFKTSSFINKRCSFVLVFTPKFHDGLTYMFSFWFSNFILLLLYFVFKFLMRLRLIFPVQPSWVLT